jgi:uncharacterized protein (DUF1810 family)
MEDAFDLQRFIDAQDPVIDQVRGELRRGRKTSHWMWFVFPQIAGLGYSPMAERFALHSLDEAEAYLDHSVLGPRLLECTRLVNAVSASPIGWIFASPDDLKFHACMTLFDHVAAGENAFALALDGFFGGARHAETLELGRRESAAPRATAGPSPVSTS